MFKCEAISLYVPLSPIYIFVFYILGTTEKKSIYNVFNKGTGA